MEFRTKVTSEPRNGLITHDTPVMLMGSCFTDNIGQRLLADGFQACVNPLGILYNPASILEALKTIVAEGNAPEPRFVQRDGTWCSLDHHSVFHADTCDELRSRCMQAAAEAREWLTRSRVLFITLGTAYAFIHKASGRVVANCHKLPADDFTRTLLTVDEIGAMLSQTIAAVHRVNPHCEVLFTVSPIRHLADGLHGNNISKASLLLAIEQAAPGRYFPAYEAVIDDLRDYRFYEADMKHPSTVAVDYIYEIFQQTYFSPATISKAHECRRESRRSNHIPLLSKQQK